MAVLFLCAAIPAFTQDRRRMSVYIPMPTGGTSAQNSYFLDNFRLELVGANYPYSETQEGSMYTLLLDISDNPDFDSTYSTDNDNPRYYLGIKLQRTSDDYEIVSFSFPFSDTEAMASWNLFLLYQALANAYVPEEDPPPPIDNSWRNKWLYLSIGAGVDSTHFSEDGTNRLFWGLVMPVAMMGLEFQFVNILSLQLGLGRLRMLNNGEAWIFSLSAPALLKWVIKPDYTRFSNVMLEVYAGAEYIWNFGGEAPYLAALGGIELGIKGGRRSAWTLVAEAEYSLLGKASMSDGSSYSLLRFTLALGWKAGFIDRWNKADVVSSVNR
jgi:hypothetical protein